jgi:hypothetical protein
LDDTESVGTDHSIESDVYDYDTDMPELIEELNILDNIPLIPALNTDINNIKKIFQIMVKKIFHIMNIILKVVILS